MGKGVRFVTSANTSTAARLSSNKNAHPQVPWTILLGIGVESFFVLEVGKGLTQPFSYCTAQKHIANPTSTLFIPQRAAA